MFDYDGVLLNVKFDSTTELFKLIAKLLVIKTAPSAFYYRIAYNYIFGKIIEK